MKQIWPNYSYSPATNVLTLTGLNIDRDQLLLVTAADRGRIMYNFADSSVTASAFTSGANTSLTLVATTAGLTTTAALVIYYDDQVASNSVTGTVELGPTSLNALESITVTMGQVTVTGGLTDTQLRASAVTIAGTVTANGLAVGTTVANVFPIGVDTQFSGVRTVTDLIGYRLPISLGDSSAVVSASLYEPLPTGTNRIGVVTIGGGTVTIGAGTAQIGSVTVGGTVTANIGGIASSVTLPVRLIAERTGGAPTGEDTLLTCNSNGMLLVDAQSAGTSVLGFDGNAFVQVKQVSGSSVTIGNTVTIAGTVTANPTGTQTIAGSVTLGASTAQIGSVTASISNTVVTFYPLQGTTVSNTNFTSTTASTTLVSAVAGREVLTVFNEGAGNLFISPGATCTTIAYQVRLSAGDYWECPAGQLSLAHTAVFATAGTARVCQVS